jgi:hypothetical protein
MPEKMQGWQKSSAGTGSFPKPGWDTRKGIDSILSIP